MLRFVFGVAVMALSAMGQLIDFPIYNYFYSCESGVEDCVNFDKNQNYFGDFGMNGVVPTNWPSGQPTFGLDVLMSNQRGEVLGRTDFTTGGALSYGFNGQVTCIGGYCNDEDWLPKGINGSGLYVFQTLFESGCIGNGTAVASLGPGPNCSAFNNVVDLLNFNTDILSIRPLGINDSNQILAQVRASDGYVEGVLSPSAVPEPSAILLFATVLGMCIMVLRKRTAS